MLRQNRLVFTGRELLYIAMALLLFFQIYLQTTISVMQYFDEFVAVVCLIKVIQIALMGGLEKSHVKMLMIMAAIAAIGLISGMVSNVQTNLAPILTDIGNTFKIYIAYLGSVYYLKGVSNKKRIISVLAAAIRVFAVVLFVCMILHFAGVLNMGDDVRYGIRSFQFVSTGAGNLSVLFYGILLILTIDMQNGGRQRGKLKYILMVLAVWVSTLRARAFMFVLIYIYLYWITIIRQKRFRISAGNVLLILGVLLLFGMDQLETYFSSMQVARANLLKYGVYTMQRYFPLGSGFATYGTDAAVKYYSNLYVEYGFESVYGLSRNYAAFAHDTYWPAVFAQFGIFGTMLVAWLIFCILRDITRRARNKYGHVVAVFICITQLASSVATATFFNFVTVGLFFFVPLLFSDGQEVREDAKRGQ